MHFPSCLPLIVCRNDITNILERGRNSSQCNILSPIKRTLLPWLLFLWLLIFCACVLFLVSTSMKKSSAICLLVCFYKEFAQNLWELRYSFLVFYDFSTKLFISIVVYIFCNMYVFDLFISWYQHCKYFQIKFNSNIFMARAIAFLLLISLSKRINWN